MSTFFHFSCRTVLIRFDQAFDDHLVQLHEMIVAGLYLNHFSQIGKMVNWNSGAQRQHPILESGKQSKRLSCIVGAPLVETASVETVIRSSVVQQIEIGGGV